EQAIDALERELPPLQHFILPAGAGGASELHWARTVARRAERHAVALGVGDRLSPDAAAYLNRLSDYLFVAARRAAHACGEADEIWPGDRGDTGDRDTTG
ncbi:MAG TPA: ATP:cob(I)alamin adenosyltransferase, partial [Limnochordia bacterium]